MGVFLRRMEGTKTGKNTPKTAQKLNLGRISTFLGRIKDKYNKFNSTLQKYKV